MLKAGERAPEFTLPDDTGTDRSLTELLSAGAIIDQAGLKGAKVGGAEVSDKHANFVIAHPGCKADDVLRLVKLIREKVWEKNQIHLESEVQIWGQ